MPLVSVSGTAFSETRTNAPDCRRSVPKIKRSAHARRGNNGLRYSVFASECSVVKGISRAPRPAPIQPAAKRSLRAKAPAGSDSSREFVWPAGETAVRESVLGAVCPPVEGPVRKVPASIGPPDGFQSRPIWPLLHEGPKFLPCTEGMAIVAAGRTAGRGPHMGQNSGKRILPHDVISDLQFRDQAGSTSR